jgi:hypothetical protein
MMSEQHQAPTSRSPLEGVINWFANNSVGNFSITRGECENVLEVLIC